MALALNLAGPAEAFSVANHFLGPRREGYKLIFLSEAGGSVRTSSGLRVETQPLASVAPNKLDTIIVGGGSGADAFTADDPLIRWIAAASRRTRRICSICNGAFLLAAACVLDGRRAATHWCEVEKLRTKFPDISVELDPIYIRDGNVWTSAGMSAGIDLALALIEEDHGRALSLSVAKELVVFLRRPRGQTQFSSVLTAQTRLGSAPAAKLADLPAWVMNHLGSDLSVERLAAFAGMTQRTFARNFTRWHGGTPARFVEEMRIEAACRSLEGESDIKRIAELCGFGDEERMRRAFIRRRGIPPSIYRERFGRKVIDSGRDSDQAA